MPFDKTVALIGNPNCGKTTLFNALTGSHQYVGNWPGVTVEKKSGFFEADGKKIEVVDLPGVYSLSEISASSQDERVAREYLLFQKPDCVINILDASNLERNLYMTVQLFEMRVPVILVLNMMDAAAALKIKIDAAKLSADDEEERLIRLRTKLKSMEKVTKYAGIVVKAGKQIGNADKGDNNSAYQNNGQYYHYHGRDPVDTFLYCPHPASDFKENRREGFCSLLCFQFAVNVFAHCHSPSSRVMTAADTNPTTTPEAVPLRIRTGA